MDSFDSYLLRKLYVKTAKLGDKLAEVEPLIDWKRFRPIIQPMYSNQEPAGGRPNIDPVIMVKLLTLQQWYGLSDPELERQVNDRISFRHFLGYPERAPDYSTVWRFRERLAETGRDRLVWAELQRQLDAKDVDKEGKQILLRVQAAYEDGPESRSHQGLGDDSCECSRQQSRPILAW
jgi:IS5 family transposase